MTPSQRKRLIEIQERIIEVAIFELDPTYWPGHGLRPFEMDKETRGDRTYAKRDAGATLSIVGQISRLAEDTSFVPPSDMEEKENLVSAYEKQAQELIERAMAGHGF